MNYGKCFNTVGLLVALSAGSANAMHSVAFRDMQNDARNAPQIRALAHEFSTMQPGASKDAFVGKLHAVGGSVENVVKLSLEDEERNVMKQLEAEHGITSLQYRGVKLAVKVLDTRHELIGKVRNVLSRFGCTKPSLQFIENDGAIPQDMRELLAKKLHEKGINRRIDAVFNVDDGMTGGYAVVRADLMINGFHPFFTLKLVPKTVVLHLSPHVVSEITNNEKSGLLGHELEHVKEKHVTMLFALSGIAVWNALPSKDAKKEYLKLLVPAWFPSFDATKVQKRLGQWQGIVNQFMSGLIDKTSTDSCMAYSRWFESCADRKFASKNLSSAQDCECVLMKIHADISARPDLFQMASLDKKHPPLPERIRMLAIIRELKEAEARLTESKEMVKQ